MVKHTQTIRRQQPTNCLKVFDHFVELVLKGLVNHEFDLYLILTFTSRSTKGKQLGSPRNLVQLMRQINVLYAIKLCIRWKNWKPKEFLITNFVLNVQRVIGPWGKLKQALRQKFLVFVRSSHHRCSMKKSVLKYFAKFTGKLVCQSFFFNKVTGLNLACQQLY